MDDEECKEEDKEEDKTECKEEEDEKEEEEEEKEKEIIEVTLLLLAAILGNQLPGCIGWGWVLG